MWGRKKNRILELEAYRQQLVEGRAAAIETALDQAARDHAAQCEHLADDVEKWYRKAHDLEAGAKRVADQNRRLRGENEDLREQVATLQSRSALVALDGEYEDLYGRLCRALRGCARWRQQAATLTRLCRTLHRQLDDATGMDHPDIAAGVDWQHRRADKQEVA